MIENHEDVRRNAPADIRRVLVDEHLAFNHHVANAVEVSPKIPTQTDDRLGLEGVLWHEATVRVRDVQGRNGGGGRLLPDTFRVGHAGWASALPRLADVDSMAAQSCPWQVAAGSRRAPAHEVVRSGSAFKAPVPTCTRAAMSSPYKPNLASGRRAVVKWLSATSFARRSSGRSGRTYIC